MLYYKKIFLLVIVILFSCLQDAPRNNPLDSKNTYTSDLPKIDYLEFYSCVINANITRLELMLYVKIDDSKHPIDVLYVDSPVLKKRIALDYITQESTYHCKLTSNEHGLYSPEKVIGEEFKLVAVDRDYNEITLETIEIRRIVKEDVNLLNPIGADTVSSPFSLEWESDFDNIIFPQEREELEKIYRFYVEILTNEMQMVWSKDSLSIQNRSIEVDQSLIPDTYRWAVWIIDKYKNRSRSRLKSFRIE